MMTDYLTQAHVDETQGAELLVCEGFEFAALLAASGFGLATEKR